MIGKLDPEESVMDSDLIATNRRAKAIIRSITAVSYTHLTLPTKRIV